MIEIAQARKVYGAHAVGNVLLEDGRIVIHLENRNRVVEWAHTTYTSFLEALTRVIERDPTFYNEARARLQRAIDRARTAQTLARRTTYEDCAVIRRAEELLQSLPQPSAATPNSQAN